MDSSDEPQKCFKFHHSTQQYTNSTDATINETCNPESFDKSSKEKCNKWVFGETERTIVNDVNKCIN